MTDKTHRGHMSRIDGLGDEFKALVNRGLRSGMSQRAILRKVNAALEDAGEKPISQSGLNRYALKMEAVGRRMRESREMAEMWTAKLGEEPTANLTSLIVDMLQSATFDLLLRIDGNDDGGDSGVTADTVNKLALGVQRLARAHSVSARREQEIRLAALKEASEKLADRDGLSAEAGMALRRYVNEYAGAPDGPATA